MGTSICVKPVYGPGGQGAAPVCTLLELDGALILLDCGSPDLPDPSLEAALVSLAPRLDAVLVSHGDAAHLGSLPLLFKQYATPSTKAGAKTNPTTTNTTTHPLKRAPPPFYMTRAAARLGHLALYDLHQARREMLEDDDGSLGGWDLDAVDAVFAHATPLHFSQPALLPSPHNAISVVALPAGHSLGGALWRVQKESDVVAYAPRLNQQGERHLAGAASALEGLHRPAVLITGAAGAAAISSTLSRKAREAAFVESVVSTLRAEGSVLIPTETAGRALEALLVLDAHWSERRELGASYRMAWLTGVAYSALETARSSLEFMSGAVARAFERSRENPLALKHVTPCHTREELETLLSPGPKVVAASFASLELGPARALFAEWALDPRNAVVFVHRPHDNTLGRRLQAAAGGTASMPPSFALRLGRRVPLTGEELAAHEEKARLAKAVQEAANQEAEQRQGTAAPPDEQHQPSQPSQEDTQSQAAGGPARPRRRRRVRRRPPRGAGGAVDTLLSGVFFDGFRPVEGAAGPMYPLHTTTATDSVAAQSAAEAADEYGEGPDERIVALAGAGADMFDEMDRQGPGEDVVKAVEPEPEAPTKVVYTNMTLAHADVTTTRIQVHMNCRVLYFDFDGVSDMRSLRQILQQVAPIRLVLTEGRPETTDAVLDFVSSSGLQTVVYVPGAGEAVDVSFDKHAFKVHLEGEDGEEGQPALEWETAGDWRVARVTARLAAAARAEASSLASSGGVQSAPVFTLQVCAAEASSAAQRGRATLVGDPKLADLRHVLSTRAKIPAEFSEAGSLACGAYATVHKLGPQRVVLEGTLGDEWFRVREVVYSQYQRL
eukprot:jgi/Chlat1/6022/Chrsp4S06202